MSISELGDGDSPRAKSLTSPVSEELTVEKWEGGCGGGVVKKK